jgi:hypothetical protein
MITLICVFNEGFTIWDSTSHHIGDIAIIACKGAADYSKNITKCTKIIVKYWSIILPFRV